MAIQQFHKNLHEKYMLCPVKDCKKFFEPLSLVPLLELNLVIFMFGIAW